MRAYYPIVSSILDQFLCICILNKTMKCNSKKFLHLLIHQMVDEFLPLHLQISCLLLGREPAEGIARLHEADHPGDTGIGEAVKHMFAAFLALHHMRFLQDVQMLTDRRELLIGPGDEITDTELPSLQIFCNPESCRMRLLEPDGQESPLCRPYCHPLSVL